MNKLLEKVLPAALAVVVALALFLISPWALGGVALAYAVFGAIDVGRNDLGTEARVVRQYFAGNGFLTWVLSPFNLLMDVLSKPQNGVLKRSDLPEACQKEIDEVIAVATRESGPAMERIRARIGKSQRAMLLYKWYGRQIDTSVPEFNKSFRYVKTVGVSLFQSKTTTRFHYGPLRITYRVLYNLDPIESEDVYIQVGRTRHLWRDDPLFIFDDTLMHRSVNESDRARPCLFVDIMRPSRALGLTTALLSAAGVLLGAVNRVFYKNWAFIS